MLREINKNSTIEELQKSQFLRVVDVIFLGPLIIYAGAKVSEQPLKHLLFISGALVIANNYYNFRKNLS
jgi:hypothetical protein